MRLLDRYLLRELLVPLGICLCGFLLLWISSDLFTSLGEFQRKALLARDIAEYYLVVLPEFVVLVLPIALLLAMLYALTNHARHQEITAIRAAGVSLWRLALPHFGVGLFAAVTLFVVNEFWAPQSADKSKAIMNRRVAASASGSGPNERQRVSFENSRDGFRWVIGLYDSVTGEMNNVAVSPIERTDNTKPWEFFAASARLTNGVWTFYDVRVLKQPPEIGAPVPTLVTNELSVPEFTNTVAEINSEIRIRENMTPRAAKKADVPIRDLLNYARVHPQLRQSDRAWVDTKLQGRLAAPWTCLVVVLIALPFGAAGGRRNVFVGVASSIVICFIYFVLQQLGLALGTSGKLPPWLAAWFPNLSFGMVGLLLTTRIR